MIIKVNHRKKDKTFINVWRNSVLIAIFFIAVSIIIFESYFGYIDFSTRAKKFESEYLVSQKSLIKQEVIKITDYISLKRSEVKHKTEKRIKHRVYEAHAMASNIYAKFNGKLPNSQIKKLIIEALRPLRFFNGNGYYYIHSLAGINQLHPLRPEVEGKGRFGYKNSQGRYLVKELVSLVKNSNEGFLSYDFPSFKNKKIENSKIAFVKRFKPFDWLIGSGDYLETVEKEIQQEMLGYIEQIRFGDNSYIFVVDYQGVVLMNVSQKHLMGTNIWETTDPNGIKVVQEEHKAVGNPEGGFIHYVWNKPSTSTPSPKISFIKGVKDWQWMIGAGLYVDDAQLVIQKQKNVLKGELIDITLSVILVSFLLGVLVIYIANLFSRKISGEMNLFLEFFENVSIKAEKINVDSIHYKELRQLAESANKMLDKQIEIEAIRTKTELSLRASESSLKEAQRITHYGSWEYNVITGDLYWSDEVFRILGLDPENTTPSYELFMSSTHPDDRERVNTTYKNSVVNRKPYDIEHRIKLPDGEIKRVREHIEMVYDDKGKTIRSNGTIHDVTELREKEEIIKRSQKMDALGKLTGGIAHDYNNMLGVILGYSDLLLEQADATPQTINYVTQIRNAGERAKALTAKLMSFTRSKSSQLEPVDINAELSSYQQMLEKSLTARIKLKLNLTKNVWLVELDSGDLNDAIINIAINASHAIDANGTISITTKNLSINSHEASLLSLAAGDYVSLSISDTGHGMDSQTMTQIFDPFYTTKGDKGTGLGLSQVYGFVIRCGGSISVESELGVGTEFIFYFPRYLTGTLPAEKKISNKRVTNGNETILVVDDEVALCTMAKEILTSHGYHVFVATSAQQALLLLEVETIDLLFSDVIMPGINGYQLADEVTKKYPHVLIYLASGYNDVVNISNDTDVSDINVLQKPYTASELLAQIRTLLDANK